MDTAGSLAAEFELQFCQDDAPDTASGTTLCYFPYLEEPRPEMLKSPAELA